MNWQTILYLLLSSFAGLNSCASMKTTCEFQNGVLQTYSLRSTVVGTGETEVISTGCAAIAYSTEDTGLSDNGKAALGEIAEGAARGAVGALVPGAGLL